MTEHAQHAQHAYHAPIRSLLRASDHLREREGSEPLLLSTGSDFRLCAYQSASKTYIDDLTQAPIESTALEAFSSVLERLGFVGACTIIPGTRHLRLPTLAAYDAALKN